MPRLIDADVAYKILTDYYHHRTETQHDALIEALSKVPTVDAKLVVRCKDCKYYYVYNGHNFCDLDIEMMRDLDPNYYCASAERKEDAN